MKILKYQLMTEVNIGTEEEPNIVTSFNDKVIECLDEAFEKMLTIAKAEAYNGEYIIEDDGQPEPIETPTQLDRIESQVVYNSIMLGTLMDMKGVE